MKGVREARESEGNVYANLEKDNNPRIKKLRKKTLWIFHPSTNSSELINS